VAFIPSVNTGCRRRSTEKKRQHWLSLFDKLRALSLPKWPAFYKETLGFFGNIGMEVIAGSSRLDVALTDGKVAEAFALFTLFGVAEKDGLELVDDLLVRDGCAVEFGGAAGVKRLK
jgi:hypothetical protein